MKWKRSSSLSKLLKLLIAGWIAIAVGAGCITRPSIRKQVGESIVLIESQPAALAHMPISGEGIEIRNTYERGSSTVIWEKGRDYAIDLKLGTISRVSGSRIPDFSTNSLFGKEAFDHNQFPGFGNAGFFAFVDYHYRGDSEVLAKAPTDLLSRSRERLRQGGDFKLVAFGDSISAGGDASRPGLIFWNRWSDALQLKYPKAHLKAINGSTGGDSTVQGLQRIQAKVLDEKPDLVLLGFGMNDHNINGVPIPEFGANLKQIIATIRTKTNAEIVLFSAFPPNPKWKFGSHRMEQYANATRQVALEERCAYADVFTKWQRLAKRKKPEDLLGNNINHPNDFGHSIYLEAFMELGL